MKRAFVLLFALSFHSALQSQESKSSSSFLTWSDLEPLPDDTGFAAPFAGISNGALLVAGGANFPDGRPWDGHPKVWHDRIFVMTKKPEGDAKGEWITAKAKLPKPSGYGVSISTSYGVIAIGGCDKDVCHSEVFVMKWNAASNTVEVSSSLTLEDGSTIALPSLPQATAFASGAQLGGDIYIVGGQHNMKGDTTSKPQVFRLKLSNLPKSSELKWETLPWPANASSRVLPIAVAQHDGRQDCLFMFSGRKIDAEGKATLLKDAWKLIPSQISKKAAEAWHQIPDSPTCIMAGTGLPIGSSGIHIIGGADGRYWSQDLKDEHPGFPNEIHYTYHTVTEKWLKAPPLPLNLVTTTAVKWDEDIIIPGGESRPAVRSNRILIAKLNSTQGSFGWVNYLTIAIYLAVLVGVGIYTSSAGESTKEFFLGGQRIPWWAAGLSIFGTQLSAITFMAIPALVFRTDWVYFWANMMICIAAVITIYIYLPFYRKLNVTTAYEYLEKRFSTAVRCMASASFVLFQIGRMGIVLYLPALALSTVTNLNIYVSILMMGVLATFYTVMGGIEAVIWTDVLQVIVLAGGALLILFGIASDLDGGWSEIFSAGQEANKFHQFNWTWDFTTTAVWVVVVGKILEQLMPYSADQAVVQRYLTTPDQKSAARSLWMGGFLVIPASLLFFGLGTALWVYYRAHPENLNPAGNTESILPWFVATELPQGIAGIVIAGLFAASMSSLDSALNSCSTAITTDFYKRFKPGLPDKHYLGLAKQLTIILGVLGTGFALYMAYVQSKSIFDVYLQILGLFGGGLAGLFALGIFTRRGTATGALAGFIVSAIVLYIVKTSTDTHFFLFAGIGMMTCILIGILVSSFSGAQDKDLTGLTLYDTQSKENE